jgi:hypothetical protein
MLKTVFAIFALSTAPIGALATKEDLKNLEVSLHRDIRSNTWLMITWVTAVVSMAMTGVFYVARYVPG